MKKRVALIGGTLFAVSLAVAQQVTFEELDSDGSGSINKDEAAAHEQLSEAFDSVDTDANGELSQEEFSAVIQ